MTESGSVPGTALSPALRSSPRIPTSVFPRLTERDSTLALLREGYAFGLRRFQQHGTDVFQTRLVLRRAAFAYGAEAAQQFYEPDRLTRRGALPVPSLTLLLDLGSVSMLDGPQHSHRKSMFLSLMTPAALASIADLVEDVWRSRLPAWERAGRIVLLDELHEVLCAAVCAWAGVPLDPGDLRRRTRELVAMFEGAGTVGPRNWRGHVHRRRCEHWVEDLVSAVRSGRVAAPEGCALRTVAEHRDVDGALLSPADAAVELINVLRPTVAVARFVVFAALALHEHPEQRTAVSDAEQARWFVQEVRRHYPFFPVVGGRVRDDFTWRGARLHEGTWLLLDLYATDHDPRIWGDPEQFRPERFRDGDGSAFELVPQGGGDHETGHRCAGEWLTIALVQRAVHLLTTGMDYGVPPQDLRVPLSRMPARPVGGLVLTGIRARRQ